MFACCAFAVFLLNQLLFPFVAIYRRLFGTRDHVSAAAIWTPGERPVSMSRTRLAKPAFAALITVELTLLGGSVAVASALTSGGKPPAFDQSLLKNIPFCGGTGAF